MFLLLLRKKRLLQQIQLAPPSSGIANVYQLPSSWDVHELFVLYFLGNAVLQWYSIFIFIFGKVRLSSTKQPLAQYFQHSSHVRKILYVFSRSQSRFSGFGRKNKKPHKPYNKFSMMMWYIIWPEEKNTGRMWSKRTWSDNSTTTDKTLVRVDMIPCTHIPNYSHLHVLACWDAWSCSHHNHVTSWASALVLREHSNDCSRSSQPPPEDSRTMTHGCLLHLTIKRRIL